MIFWDTSAIIRRFEPWAADHARAVHLWTSHPSHACMALLLLETSGALIRRWDRTPGSSEAVLDHLAADLRNFQHVEPSEEVVRMALRIVRTRRLTGMDALHVAAARWLQTMTRPRGLRFVTADTRQAQGARAEGLRVIQLGP